MSPGVLGPLLPKISDKKRLCGQVSGNSSTGRGEQPWEPLLEDQSCCISCLGEDEEPRPRPSTPNLPWERAEMP